MALARFSDESDFYVYRTNAGRELVIHLAAEGIPTMKLTATQVHQLREFLRVLTADQAYELREILNHWAEQEEERHGKEV